MPGSDWDVHYQGVNPPWETGQPSSELARVIAERKIAPCRVIEIGCGSGVNAIWLAHHGFDVTAIDFSTLAIARSRERAATAKVDVRFAIEDVLDLQEAYEPFPFFFDRGCYHAVRRSDAKGYVRALERLTKPGAVGLILAGNAKSKHDKHQGPPTVSEDEMRGELEPTFEIVQLREFQFDRSLGDPTGFLAWSCFLRRR